MANSLEKKIDEFIEQNIEKWRSKVRALSLAYMKEKKVLVMDNDIHVVNFDMDLFNLIKERDILLKHNLKPNYSESYKLSDL